MFEAVKKNPELSMLHYVCVKEAKTDSAPLAALITACLAVCSVRIAIAMFLPTAFVQGSKENLKSTTGIGNGRVEGRHHPN